MSLFESFTGPKWQHSNPQIRRHAVAELDDPGILLELVRTDPDPGVRAAALSHIGDPDALDELIQTLPPDLQQQARAQRLAQLLPSPGHLASIHDDATLLRIATLSDQPELMAEAIGRMESTELRMDLACSHPVASVRLAAAASIRDIGLLGELMQRSRGHDKGVYRHCKSVLDEHHARQLAEAQQQEKIEHVIEQATELAEAAESPEYAVRCRGLELQWKVLADGASAGQRQRFDSELARCAARLEQHALARAQHAAAGQEAREQRAAAAQAIANLLAEFEQLDATTPLPENRDAVRQLGAVLDDLEARFEAAESLSPPPPEDGAAVRSHLEQWRNLAACSKTLLDRQSQLDKLLGLAEHADASDYQALQGLIERAKSLAAALPWPESMHARQPAALTRLHLAVAHLQNQLDDLEKNQGKFAARVQTLLDTARSELDQQHTREADRALGKARRALQSIAPAQRRRFEQDMKPLAAQLHEVHEWLGFAIEPKKVELCARMRALVDSAEAADTLAVKIKSLQEEWKQLGALPDAREQALWLEFKAAADEAWRPCKAAFAQRAALHRRNLEARMRLVTQLAEYEQKMAWPDIVSEAATAPAESSNLPAGAKPDWRMVQKTLDTARAAFAEIKPLDQSGERKSQKALRAVCDRIYHHVQQEYERNITLKKQLVERAVELAASEDLPKAIEHCKKIQREWKEVGITPVAVDRKLWKEFRAACDAVFARLDAQRLQDEAALGAQLKHAEGLRDQARALLDSAGEEQDLTLDKTLADMRQQLEALALPLAVQQRLSRDFQAIQKQARDRAGTLRARREKASWTQLVDTIKACALNAADAEAAIPSWREGSGELPKGIDAGLLEAFWRQGPAEADPGQEAQLREACIALEVLAETESPAEDRAARMQYQMRRLATAMGSRRAETVKSRMDHINAFIALRPPRQWAERFCNTLGKMPG